MSKSRKERWRCEAAAAADGEAARRQATGLRVAMARSPRGEVYLETAAKGVVRRRRLVVVVAVAIVTVADANVGRGR
jgi:hypothetical protein